MSAGVFTNTRYQATYDTAAIHPIRVQPETLGLVINAVTNTAPTGSITNPISAMVGSNKRKLGLHAAMVSIKFTGTPPTGYATGTILRLPLLRNAMVAEAVRGATGTYQGVAIEVVSTTTGERVV